MFHCCFLILIRVEIWVQRSMRNSTWERKFERREKINWILNCNWITTTSSLRLKAFLSQWRVLEYSQYSDKRHILITLPPQPQGGWGIGSILGLFLSKLKHWVDRGLLRTSSTLSNAGPQSNQVRANTNACRRSRMTVINVWGPISITEDLQSERVIGEWDCSRSPYVSVPCRMWRILLTNFQCSFKNSILKYLWPHLFSPLLLYAIEAIPLLLLYCYPSFGVSHSALLSEINNIEYHKLVLDLGPLSLNSSCYQTLTGPLIYLTITCPEITYSAYFKPINARTMMWTL